MWCNSTSRPALFCVSLLLCATLTLAQAQQDSPYRVTYDNGVTLEIIAVSMPPSRLKPFWDPTGAKLLERPYDARETASIQTVRPDNAPKIDTANYEVVVKITGLKDNPLHLQQKADPDIYVSYPAIPFAKGAKAEDLRVYQLGVPRSLEVVDFDIAVAANNWQNVRTFTGLGVSGDGPTRIEILEPDQHQRNLQKDMHYFVKLAPSQDALRVVAIDDAGAAHISTGAWWMGGQENHLEVVLPGLAKEKVKQYRIEKAAYEWKSLKSIHLRPQGDWDKLLRENQVNRLLAAELRFDPQKDEPRIYDAIDKISRTRAFDDSDTWVGAIRDLSEIGPPAIPAIIAELQQTSRPYARSSLAIALRAIGDPRAVSGLIESLANCPFAPNDYGGGTTKDPALLHFMLDIQRGGGYRGQQGPTYDLGRPVNEITYSLEGMTGHKVRGRYQTQNERPLYQDAADQWRTWWEKNRTAPLGGLPVLRSAKNEQWSKLHLAIAGAKADQAKSLINGGADINAAGVADWRPLHLATALGQLDTVRLLLDKKADIAAKTADGCTALHVAVGMGLAPIYTPLPKSDVKLINLLIERGVDTKAVDARGRTALHGAVAASDSAVVELLLDIGLPINIKDSRGRTALHRAVECNNEPAADLLLDAGADVNAKDADGKVPLRMAFYSLYYLDYNPPLVAKLLARGTDVDLATTIALGTARDVAAAIKRNPAAINEKAKTDYEETPLQFAVRRKSPEMIKTMIDAGADPNIRDKSGNAPLHMAVQLGDKPTIAALLAGKADINAKGQGGVVPLYWACSNLNVELVEQLLAAGAKYIQADQNAASSPLNAAMSAAKDNNRMMRLPGTPQQKLERAKIIVKSLLDHGADANERNWNYQFTPIFGAPRELAELLLERGARLDVTNIEGDTPLHYAAVFSDDDATKFLLEHGVALEVKNKKGETPLHKAVAIFQPKGETLKMLLEKGADPKAKDNDGRTPLHRAAMQGSPISITTLLDKGSDIEAKDNDGAAPLHLAAKAGHDQAILLFLKRGALIDSKDTAGRTPLQWATNDKTRKLLMDQGAVDAPAK